MSKYTFYSEELIGFQVIGYIINNILDITINGKIEYEQTNTGYILINNKNEFEIITVDRGNCRGQPMLDIIIYKDLESNYKYNIKKIDNCIIPHSIIEITKNDSGDSGNQCYQRIEKFIYAKRYWGKHFNTINKHFIYTIYIENSNKSKSWDISYKIMKLLDICVHRYNITKNTSNIITNTIIPLKTISELCEYVNSTRQNNNKNINNRIYFDTNKNCIEITSNLIHSALKAEKSPINDPNTGFVCGIIEVIKIINPECTIKITKNCKLYPEHIHKPNVKLWNIIEKYSKDIEIYDRENRIINKVWKQNIGSECYIKYSESEKLSSMYIHQYIEKMQNNDIEICFHNHAGCERSFLKVRNSYYKCTAKNIPDLVVVNYTKKIIAIIEGKINNKPNIVSAQRQLEKSVEWIKQNLTTKKFDKNTNWDNFKIKTYICTYGGHNHPEGIEDTLIFSMLNNHEIKNNINWII